MTDYQQPLTNAIPMPAPVQPIVDQLPLPDVQVPALPQMPQLPAPSAEAHAQAHLGIAQDLTLDADLQARLGLNGGSASAASRLQYGTDENGAAIYGSASTQNGVVGGAQLALTDEQLRLRMAASTADGGSAHGSLAGGDDYSSAEVAASVQDLAGVPQMNADGTIRTGPLVVNVAGRDLTGDNPQGKFGAGLQTPLAPGVNLGMGGTVETSPDGPKGGGEVELDVDTGAGDLKVNGNMQGNGNGMTGGANILYEGQF